MPARTHTTEGVNWRREVAILAIVGVMAWYFVYLRYLLNQDFPLATPDAFLSGTAHKPFQFRMLVPWIVGWFEGLGVGETRTLFMAADVAAVVGLYYAFRLLMRRFVARGAEFLAFAIFYALPWNYLLARDLAILLPYDLAAVALTTLAWALALRGDWRWFYPVFVAATFNRETILFVTLAIGLVEWARMPRGRLYLHLGVQAAIWVGVKILMGSLYESNPGQTFEFFHVGSQVPHWRTNVNILLSWPHLVLVLSSFGFSWLLIPAGWKHITDANLRKSLWVAVPFVGMIFLIGNLNEIRVFGELLPFVLAPALVVVTAKLRGGTGS